MNVTAVPRLVELRKQKVLAVLDQERNRLNQFGKKLTDVQHATLRDVEFHTGYHQKMTYHELGLDDQNPRPDSYLDESYFLHPTFEYNRTNLLPTQVV
ncbi:unnamed protein product, partial [Amoebophrya sp. A25]|eukprot:GSA25T00002865001.1